MTKWNERGEIKANNDATIKEFLNKTGAKKIDHYGTIKFGKPDDVNFLDNITYVSHIYSVGDRLSNIAYKYYKDAKLWWVIAWFNNKPTDFHCKIGDVINIPEPLPEVLAQAYGDNQG